MSESPLSQEYDPPVFLPPDDVSGMEYSLAPTLWHLPADVWEREVWPGATGKGVKIFVLDTGYTKHVDGPEAIAEKSFIPRESVRDGNSHGTHCIGTALGRNGIGVAPEAELGVGKVLSNGGEGSSSGIAAGVRWAVDAGADIISMSLGGRSSYGPTNEAIDYAFSKGCIVNVAAGNSGYNGANTIGWPAKYPGALCCAAYRKDGNIANFSSGGRQIDWGCPGQDIVSFSNNGSGFRSMSGTSMATPFGSGVLALIVEVMRRQGLPSWTATDAVREFFKKNMTDAGEPGFDVRFGWGIPLVTELIPAIAKDNLEFV